MASPAHMAKLWPCKGPREKEVVLVEYLLSLLGTVLDALEILTCSPSPQSCFIPIL